MLKKTDKVSIIMPAYNAEQYIGQSLQSVRDQLHPNWELIVVDDGSLDSTLAILRVFQNREPRLKVFATENRGSSNARNYAIGLAKGDFIAFLDSDDIWDNDFLTNSLAASKNASMIFSGYKLLDSRRSYRPRFLKKTQRLSSKHLCINNPIGLLTVFVKREVFNGNLFNPSFAGVEDLELWMRLVQKNDWMFCNFYSAHYRVHKGGISKIPKKMLFQEKEIVNIHLKGFSWFFAIFLCYLRYTKRLVYMLF